MGAKKNRALEHCDLSLNTFVAGMLVSYAF